MEKAVVNQLFEHCGDNAPLPTNQSSYRQIHSTKTALLKVHNHILLNMDQQEVTLLVLLDLSAAFDTIDHEILIDTLESEFGVIGNPLKWLKSFLSHRKQRVKIKQEFSTNFTLSCGVPQGSCLGQVLFLLYVSQLFQIINKHLSSSHGYADDTQLYLSFSLIPREPRTLALLPTPGAAAKTLAKAGHVTSQIRGGKLNYTKERI